MRKVVYFFKTHNLCQRFEIPFKSLVTSFASAVKFNLIFFENVTFQIVVGG